jgi:hypothetical protein
LVLNNKITFAFITMAIAAFTGISTIVLNDSIQIVSAQGPPQSIPQGPPQSIPQGPPQSIPQGPPFDSPPQGNPFENSPQGPPQLINPGCENSPNVQIPADASKGRCIR